MAETNTAGGTPGPGTPPAGPRAGEQKPPEGGKPKRAERITPDHSSKRAEKVASKQAELANGDPDSLNNGQFAEPKGTVHQDQFTTRFPSEGKHPRA